VETQALLHKHGRTSRIETAVNAHSRVLTASEQMLANSISLAQAHFLNTEPASVDKLVLLRALLETT